MHEIWKFKFGIVLKPRCTHLSKLEHVITRSPMKIWPCMPLIISLESHKCLGMIYRPCMHAVKHDFWKFAENSLFSVTMLVQVRRDLLPKFSFYFLEYFQNKVKFPNQILPGHRENIIWHVTVHPALCQIWCYLNNARWINGPQVANWGWRTCMIYSNRTSNYETRLVDKDCLFMFIIFNGH